MIGLLLFQLKIFIKYLDRLKIIFEPKFKIISYGKKSVIFGSIQSCHNTQQKPGSLKTFPSAKKKINYRWNTKNSFFKNCCISKVMYSIIVFQCINTSLSLRKCLMASCFHPCKSYVINRCIILYQCFSLTKEIKSYKKKICFTFVYTILINLH